MALNRAVKNNMKCTSTNVAERKRGGGRNLSNPKRELEAEVEEFLLRKKRVITFHYRVY